MLETLLAQSLQQWERLTLARDISTPRQADELVADVVFDTLHRNGLAADADACESETAEILRTALFTRAALLFPGDW